MPRVGCVSPQATTSNCGHPIAMSTESGYSPIGTTPAEPVEHDRLGGGAPLLLLGILTRSEKQPLKRRGRGRQISGPFAAVSSRWQSVLAGSFSMGLSRPAMRIGSTPSRSEFRHPGAQTALYRSSVDTTPIAHVRSIDRLADGGVPGACNHPPTTRPAPTASQQEGRRQHSSKRHSAEPVSHRPTCGLAVKPRSNMPP